jgi:ribosomal protein S19E (S16A)
MKADLDHELTRDQWETLKALRVPTAKKHSELNRLIVEQLIALGLAEQSDEMPVLTQRGRKALIRGSWRLWDLAA